MKQLIKNNKDIIITFFSVVFVAGLGSLFVNLGMDWFSALEKPNEWIPNFVIPIVWTIIYATFVVVMYFLIKNKLITKKIVVLSILNGIFNILWCLVFFTLNQLFLGNIIIIINALLGFLLINELLKTRQWYANFLWIYPAWLLIATTLNNAVWILN